MHKIALVLAIVAIGEGAVTLHLVRQVRAERETAQTLQARVTELERSAPQGPAAGATFVAVPTQPTASPFTTVGRTAPSQRPAAPPIGGTITAVNTFTAGVAMPVPDQESMREQMKASMERQRTLLQDPEYREAMLTQQKMMLMRSHPNVLKDLNLSAEQADRLFGTLAEQSLRSMESMNAMAWREQPDSAQMQEMHRKAMEQQSANEAELKSAVGEAKYREWQEYQNLAGVRWEADRVRASLANAGVPLDESAVKSLPRVLHEQQQQMLRQMATPASPVNGQLAVASSVGVVGSVGVSADNNVVGSMQASLDAVQQHQRRQRDALAHVLTPEQLKVIEDEHNAELQMQRAQLRLMRAQQEAGMLDPAQNTVDGVTYFQSGVNLTPSASD